MTGYELHHLYFPKRDYKSSVEKRFRELRCQKVYLTHEEHKEVHAQRRASDKPTRDEMLQKLDLCKDCKGNCIPHSQRVDHILGLIDDALGGDDEPQG